MTMKVDVHPSQKRQIFAPSGLDVPDGSVEEDFDICGLQPFVGAMPVFPLAAPVPCEVEVEQGSAVIERRLDTDTAMLDIGLMGTTVEDILFWLMIKIQKDFTTRIVQQSQRVNSMQGQLKKISGADEAGRSARREAQSSIDVEVQKLKRLTTKRRQLGEVFQQILRKYHRSAMRVWGRAG